MLPYINLKKQIVSNLRELFHDVKMITTRAYRCIIVNIKIENSNLIDLPFSNMIISSKTMLSKLIWIWTLYIIKFSEKPFELYMIWSRDQSSSYIGKLFNMLFLSLSVLALFSIIYWLICGMCVLMWKVVTFLFFYFLCTAIYLNMKKCVGIKFLLLIILFLFSL